MKKAILFFTLTLMSACLLNGMDEKHSIEKEFFMYFETLPKELQQDVRRLSALVCLGSQPITLSTNINRQIKSFLISSIVMSNNKLVTGAYDGQIMIWDIHTGHLLRIIEVGGSITSMAISGNNLVTGSGDKTVKIWNINTGQLLHPAGQHEQAVRRVAISGDKVISHSGDKSVRISDLNNGLLRGAWGRVSEFAVYGELIAIAFDNGDVEIWNLHTDDQEELQKFSSDSIISIAMNHDRVVTGSLSLYKTVKIWDVASGKSLHTLEGFVGDVSTAAINDNKVITQDNKTNKIKVWDINTGQPIFTIDGNSSSKFACNSKMIAASQNNIVKVWDINTGQLVRTLKGHTNWILSIAMSDDIVVTASRDRTVKIWPLSLNLEGAPEKNPLAWVAKKANQLQINFIKRACEATEKNEEFIIAFPSEDANIFLSFPKHVQQYLVERLNIRRKEK